MKKPKVQLIWFEHDLRISDHEGLSRASLEEEEIIGIYILSLDTLNQTQFGIPKMSHHKLQFIHESLIDLRRSLKTIHIPLYIFIDDPEKVFIKIMSFFEITKVYVQKPYSHVDINMFEKVFNAFKDLSYSYHDSKPLYHTNDLPFLLTALPDQFTLFRQIIEKNTHIRTCFDIPTTHQTLSYILEDDFKTFSTLYIKNPTPFLKGGETEANKRVTHYFYKTKKLSLYKETRNNMLNFDGSSKLSSYLALGCISPRRIYESINQYEIEVEKNMSTYWLYFELLWRDYFYFIHLKYGKKIFNKNGLFDRPYHTTHHQHYIDAWKNGQTGYPLVDANMIELLKTGWMSNRGRQNAASFFTKYINQDWRIGAAWFEYLLIDYDPSSNYGNWLYQAGLGVDSRESRIFDVTWQGEKYDPSTAYLYTWLPQFKKLPKALRYQVMTLSSDDALKYDFKLGVDYPYPIVNMPFYSKNNKI